jgi:hypothetical protein
MPDAYEDIDAGISLQCKKMEQRGVPLDLSELNLRVFRKKQELARLKETMNQRFGFIPVFSAEDTWIKVYHITTGGDIRSRTFRAKLSLSRSTVEELKEECPELVNVYKGLRLEKLISQMSKADGVKIEGQSQCLVKPRYEVDSKSGQVFLRNPNLRTWKQDLRGVIRKPGYTFLLIWYDALELSVLQDFSQDPVLESDLESLDPYKTMAGRFWDTSTPSQEQIFITRLAFNLFCNGVKPDKLWGSINTTYSDQCVLSGEDAGRLYEKFTCHYVVSCEYLERMHRLQSPRIVLRSAFGRRGEGSSSRCYAMTATATDITKLGFLSALEDSRLEKLEVNPLAIVSNKMLLSVPCSQDLEQVKGYLLSDFNEAHSKYQLKTCMTTGLSWEECEPAGDLYHEIES